MIRGTTPTITMKLPSEVSVSEVAKATISIEQSGKEKITKTYIQKTKEDEVTIDDKANTFAVKLTQKDSLSLSARNKAFVQIKVKLGDEDGTVLASFPMPMVVTDIINEEEML